MRTLGTVLMFFAAIPLIAFSPLYHWRTNGGWRRSGMGVHLMSFMGVLGMVMCFAIASAVTGGAASTNSTLPEWVRPFVWFSIGVVSWWRVGVLLYETKE